MSVLYSGSIISKTGPKVPLYASGKAAHSKYDPEREAQTFGKDCQNSAFVVIIGIAGGFHIDAFLKKNPNCKIIAVEKTQADIDFLKENFPSVKKLCDNQNIIFCAEDSKTTLEQALVQNYFPAHHGAISSLSLRSWAQEAAADFDEIMERIKLALKEISADYSVQAHFGRLWSKNIFCNLKLLKKIQESGQNKASLSESDLQKTAAVIAAGPSLDKTARILQADREKYFVIATDTALKILGRWKIKADAAVSIDAQCLSAEHFNGAATENTIFVLDLSANPSITKFAQERGAKIVFSDSGHPLVSFASRFCKTKFLQLSSGSGTVAICAADFARRCGFKRIKIFGADFGYSQGKPYAKGSYLDELYMSKQTRIQNAETAFARLMFRTELKKNDRGFYQSPTLLRYQKSMEDFLQKWEWKDLLYEHENQSPALKKDFNPNGFDAPLFKKELAALAKSVEKCAELTPEESVFLPDMAYWRKWMDKKEQNKISTNETKKLALNKILLYNEML